MIKGNPQTQCKKDPDNPGEYIWRRPLGSCYSCDSDPSFEDWKVYSNCQVTGKNQRVCNFGCMLGATLQGNPNARCKCNRKKEECHWVSRGKSVSKFNQKCIGGEKVKYVYKNCWEKPKQCVDVTEKTEIYNAWTCRNCIRIRSEWDLPATFDNRDHMVMTFTDEVALVKAAHPMTGAVNPSGDGKTWYVTFSDKALFGDRRMDFTSEWRSLGKRSKVASATGCSCKNKIPKN